VDAQSRLEQHDLRNSEQLIPGHLIGLQGYLAHPFWGLLGGWAVVCGALASNDLRWLSLALVLLLVELAWGSLWNLVVCTDWFRPLDEGWPPARPASWGGLPYTQPGSPGGRLVRGVNLLIGWWRVSFWPAVGPALLGLVAAGALTVVLAVLLPDRLRLLHAALVALLGLGVARRRRGKNVLAGQAVVQVGLSWLAGHLAFADMSGASLALALSFAATTLGALKVEAGQGSGLWLLHGGQAAAASLLVALRQPLAAGAVGFLLFGQVALQLPLRSGSEPARLGRRAWPWILAAMLVAALSIP
jgi:hypothetical protein